MFTYQELLRLIGDPKPIRSGRSMARPDKWVEMFASGQALWGTCKGRYGGTYKAAIDFRGPHFHCNCPAKSTYCRHALGLILLFQRDPEAFRVEPETPRALQAWLDQRRITAPSRKRDSDALANSAVRQRNRTERVETMIKGLEDLDNWLGDVIRQGIGSIEMQGLDSWESMASRMVDQKLGGLGRRIRSLQLLPGTESDWPVKLLEGLGELYLLSHSLQKMEVFSEPMQEELLSMAGLNVKKDWVLQQKAIKDAWLVLGVIEGADDNLTVRRVWLQGRDSQRNALILDFAHRTMSFEQSFKLGQRFYGELCFYPSTYPLRALIKSQETLPQGTIWPALGYGNFTEFFHTYAKAMAAFPLLMDFPCFFASVRPVMDRGKCYFLDDEKKMLPVLSRDMAQWQLLALSAGEPLPVFGEWNGEMFVPLSALAEGRWVGF